MKVRLIRPKAESSFNQTNFYTLPQDNKFYAAPLSVAVVASLTPEDVDVDIVDEYVRELDFEERVDLVGVSIVNSFMASKAYKIASVYRKKGVKVVFGGLHTSLFPKECLRHADSIVIGEAEDVWKNVIIDFKKGGLKRVYQSKKYPSLKNRPMPRWDLVDTKSYLNTAIIATKGCPYKCEFCLSKIHNGNKLRHRPIKDVVKEMKYIKDNTNNQNELVFWFVDYNFTADKKYAKELAKAIIPLRITYCCYTNIDIHRDKELLELLARSGCRSVAIGIESLNQKNITDANKGVTNKTDEYERAISAIHQYGIRVVGTFMIGNLHDNEKTFKELKDFITKNDLITPYIFPAAIFPKTGWCEKMGDCIMHSEFNRVYKYSYPKSDYMCDSKFWINYTKLFYDVYSPKAIFKRRVNFYRKYKNSLRYRLYENPSHIKSVFFIIKRIPKALKTGILTQNMWDAVLTLFNDFYSPYAAWQRTTCLKNFLIAHSNLIVEKYSKNPINYVKKDALLRTVEGLVKKYKD